jgi:hypothetical protein
MTSILKAETVSYTKVLEAVKPHSITPATSSYTWHYEAFSYQKMPFHVKMKCCANINHLPSVNLCTVSVGKYRVFQTVVMQQNTPSFQVTSTGNAGRYKKSFTMVIQMILCGECYKNVYT